MIKINNYEQVETFKTVPKLPKGAYILKVLDVEVLENSYGTKLKLAVDIAEGEYKDHYKQRYENRLKEDEKWKGNYYIPVPGGDDSETDETKAKIFKTAMDKFEASNKNFKCDADKGFDEQTLKGLFIGGLFNSKSWEMDGRTGVFTNLKELETVQNIKNGTYTLPSDDIKENNAGVGSNGFMNIPDGIDEELPFN